MLNAMQFTLQKKNVVIRLSDRVLRKLDEYQEIEDLPDRTTAITLLIWNALRDYEKQEKMTLGGKKARR